MRSGSRASWIRVVAAALCLLASGPCDDCSPRDRKIFSVILSGVKIFFPLAEALQTPESRGSMPLTNFYAGVAAGSGGAGSAYAYPPLDLWAPFDVSVSFGIFDPAAGQQGPFGAEACLRAESLDAQTFFAVCGSLLPGRIELSAVSSTETLSETLVLGGATRADLRVEADGKSVNFYGRESGEESWSLFASTPFQQGEPLRPIVAATVVPELSEVGFDAPHFSSAPPPDPSQEEAVAYELQLGLSDAVEAGLLLDGEGQDPVAAAALLASARGHLDTARTAAEALSGPGRKTARKISQASKKLAKAEAQFGANQFGKGFKSYAKAGKIVLQALDALLPAAVL
jgi:hypothetical protein